MADSFHVAISPCSLPKGDPVAIRVHGTAHLDYQQIQIEVITAGVANPLSKLGFGLSLNRDENGAFLARIETSALDDGFYEIGLIRMHSTPEGTTPSLDLVPVRDFPRQVFEVGSSTGNARTAAQVLECVLAAEDALERSFTDIVDLRSDTTVAAEDFTAIVFVRDLLIGIPMRCDHFEIVPTGSGLDLDDELRFVNRFLEERTATGIGFTYDERAREQNRASNPVAAVHFPTLRATTPEEARDYCAEKTQLLLLALSLSRDAGGAPFDTVVISKTTGRAVKFAVVHPYVGNLLRGDLAGENIDSVRQYIKGITTDDTNRFLVGLYKEARRERSRDFQYVRYWQIFETMAERRNYDPKEPLRDFAGQPMLEDGRALFVSGAVNSVFNLLRENQIGATDSAWRNVNVWFAFRNAVAHHGAIAQYALLTRPSVKKWAEIGYRELQKSPDVDSFLWALKEDVKLVLMRRLVASSKENP